MEPPAEPPEAPPTLQALLGRLPLALGQPQLLAGLAEDAAAFWRGAWRGGLDAEEAARLTRCAAGVRRTNQRRVFMPLGSMATWQHGMPICSGTALAGAVSAHGQAPEP